MIRLCTEKEVRDMKKYVKLFFTLMVCFTLSFSLYSVVSAQEKPTVTDDSETVVEEIPGDPTLTDEPEETTEITTSEKTEPSTEETTALSEEENNNEEEATTEEEESSDPKTNTGTPVPGIGNVKYAISKSKTATQLDENFETKVTLSLPAGEEKLATDIVFVLDKSTSAEIEAQALNMLTDLQNTAQTTGADINVGVVIFNQQANTTGFHDLATEYSVIESEIKRDISSGTNTHAGLLAAEQMLSGDTAVADSRKYMIFVSDGITYMYNETPTAIGLENADKTNVFAGPDNWATKYGSNAAPSEGWNQYLGNVAAQYEADGGAYEHAYGVAYDTNTYISYDEKADHAMSVDVALLKTYQTYQVLVSKYHCYAMTAGTSSGGEYTWGPNFMNFLANGETYSFDSIKNDIYYLVDAGSTVTDYIGYTEDYNFDFINDAEALSLKVGDQTYQAVETAENTYSFAEGNYVVAYEPGDMANGEMFTLTTNVPISQFEPVQLTYTLKLTNPKTEPGTYGQYDANGSLGYDGLYTNNSATLYPVDTNGQPGAAEEFAKPTVSYTVEEEPKEPTKPEEEKPDKKDPEKNKGADTATQTNMGLMLSLASMAISGAFILVILQKKRA